MVVKINLTEVTCLVLDHSSTITSNVYLRLYTVFLKASISILDLSRSYARMRNLFTLTVKTEAKHVDPSSLS